MKPISTTNRRTHNRPAAMAATVAAASVLVLGASAGIYPASAETDDPLGGRTRQPVASASITVRTTAQPALDAPPSDGEIDRADAKITNPFVHQAVSPRSPAQPPSTRRLGSGNPTPKLAKVEAARSGLSNRLPRLGGSSLADPAPIVARPTDGPQSAPHGSHASPVSLRTPPSIDWQHRPLGDSTTPLPSPPTRPRTAAVRPATPRRIDATKQNPQPLRAEDIRVAAKI
jgi:hypothetical protein